ncbi:Dynein regulatory complex subunit 3 [Bagarius yarrelli]|uniref:Dynein regulatory complex subunit 3 n=1 Tax=Bagarius yarrelli TaxID=175774 RepID=A0A556UEN6_BAGYA|nr:Dynein regulatory complex subunit 3 [Bagarius yarrelli]
MNKLYDTKKSNVIDEKMLEKAIKEQGPQEEAGFIASEEGVKFDQVTQLRLDYRNIPKIDNLWQFMSLTKLQLDNNSIKKIEGLDKLTNLVWLDLSFNNIEVIEGLDTLVKLEDLSLFNNQISLIENLDVLQNLQIISLGNNLISELDSIIYLRKLKNLRTLDLAGNPICKNQDYTLFVAAYLPDLVYIDYRLLDEQTRENAQDQYQNEIEKIKLNELQDQKALETQKAIEQTLQLHKDAFVEYLNGPQLFDSMFVDDNEASMTQLEEFCMQIFEEGLKQHTQRQNEVDCFFTCLQNAMDDNQHAGAKILAEFERSRRQAMAEIQQAGDHNLLKVKDKKQMCDSLLTLELQLVRNLENLHHEKVLDIAVETLEKSAKNELQVDLPDDVKMLFADKDTLINAVSESHDKHLLKIDNREDELLTRLNGWKSALMKSIQDDEIKRNRKRISDIHKYLDYAWDQEQEEQSRTETEI